MMPVVSHDNRSEHDPTEEDDALMIFQVIQCCVAEIQTFFFLYANSPQRVCLSRWAPNGQQSLRPLQRSTDLVKTCLQISLDSEGFVYIGK